MYLERNEESQATEHLQAAGSYLEKLDRQDTEYRPINKRMPTYPRRALRRGMSGWVIVEFTVTATGTVEDPEVVANCGRVQPLTKQSDCVDRPSSVFDQAALDAAAKFRYIPRFKDGAPIAVKGVQNRITFELVP
jgi:protein TonB|tara:strand:+ start:40 stop:444 length:405 start_codon:yes stop_codon:yes gene_type:complete